MPHFSVEAKANACLALDRWTHTLPHIRSLLLLQPTIYIHIHSTSLYHSSTMDVIWKELSENNPACKRLLLYSETDPGTGATFAVRCNANIGVTSEDNFTNDAMYLVEGVLPANHTLEAVEIDWSFLEPLEEGERDHLLRGIASIRSVKEILIRGGADDQSRLDVKSILVIPELASGLEHFSIEVAELSVQDAVDLELLACHLRRCQRLESVHVRGLISADQSVPLDCNILLTSLATLPRLKVIHVSQKDGQRKPVAGSALRQVCRLPSLLSLSLMNMGLTDHHCDIFLEALKTCKTLHSLVLVDNPEITEDGNEILLELLHHNRSIFNSTFGTDSDTKYRVAQLSLLHMNRCGRSEVRSPANLNNWTTYISRLIETVPEELELDALFAAVKENPEFFQGGHELHLAEREPETTMATSLSDTEILIETMGLEGFLVMRQRELDLKLRELILAQREEALAQQLRTIQDMGQRSRQEREEESPEVVEEKPAEQSDLMSLCSDSANKQEEGSPVDASSVLTWETFWQIEKQTSETFESLRDECWGFTSFGSMFQVQSLSA